LKLWANWTTNNTGLPNQFPIDFANFLDRKGLPSHSFFYKEFNIVGYSPIYKVVLNPDLLEETKLFIPRSGIDQLEIIYHRAQNSCGDLAQR
jgi:hypothetical protein